MRENVNMTEVREHGVVGLYASPPGSGPFPAVVAFGGSGGGLGPTVGWAPALAAEGLAVLAIAYFGGPGLPPALEAIEVEVVERAAQWLFERGVVAGDTVAAMGISRGSELALLASVLLDGVGPVVAFAPSGISWAALGAGGPMDAPAWTFRGEALPYVRMTGAPSAGALAAGPSADGPPLSLRPFFEFALADRARWEYAEIAVEDAKGPILLVSGEADAMWPATPMGSLIEQRASERGIPHAVVHLHYPDAGHAGAGVPGMTAETEVRHPLTGAYYALGGTHDGNEAARADSWPRVTAFLRDCLDASPTLTAPGHDA